MIYENKTRNCRELVAALYGAEAGRLRQIYPAYQLHEVCGTVCRPLNVPILGLKNSMPNAAANGITIINFGMGSANAATIMDLLSAIKPTAVLFLGKCGGLKKANNLGDYVMPIAAIRGEGTSNEYLPAEVPSLPLSR